MTIKELNKVCYINKLVLKKDGEVTVIDPVYITELSDYLDCIVIEIEPYNDIRINVPKIKVVAERIINNGDISYGNNHIDTSEMWTDEAYRTIEFTGEFEWFGDKNDK